MARTNAATKTNTASTETTGRGNKAEEKAVTKAQQTKLDGFTQVSSKVRYLNAEGFTTSQIAKTLNIRYQHARNVLITPVVAPKNK